MKKITCLFIFLIIILIGCKKETDNAESITTFAVLPIECIPTTCEELGKECDSWSDQCEGKLDCGTCPEDKKCAGGICTIVQTESCSDIDVDAKYPEGKNPLVKGWIIETGKEGIIKKEDVCSSNNEVQEYYCSSNSGRVILITCPKGTVCKEGACADGCLPKTCEALGKECGMWSDNCNGTLNCGSCMLGQECLLGKCAAEKQCIDTDGGKNYRIKGNTFSFKEPEKDTYVDFCEGDRLVEYYCDINYLVAEEKAECPNGCSDGMCI